MTSLWGELPSDDSLRPPILILREQAAALGEATNNVLQGEVHTQRDDDDLDTTLDIVAPVLDNYRYTVLAVRHGVELYPLRMYSQVYREWRQVEDEADFVAQLEQLLKSKEIHRVVAALLAQSRAGWAV